VNRSDRPEDDGILRPKMGRRRSRDRDGISPFHVRMARTAPRRAGDGTRRRRGRNNPGRIAVLGVDCQRQSLEARRLTGYLPGDLPIYPDLSARDYLSYLSRLDSRAVDPRYLRYLLARFDVSDVDQRRRLREQSHGMKQKIGIIQALMTRPPVAILDEPQVFDGANQGLLEEYPVAKSPNYKDLFPAYQDTTVALRSLAHCQSPPLVLNLTGHETLAVRDVGNGFGKRFGIEPIFSGQESGEALLSNAAKTHVLFGKPTVLPDQLIDWIAHWIMHGGAILNKPTHFEVQDGQF